MKLEEVYEPEIGVSNEMCDGTDKWLASIRIVEQSKKHLSEHDGYKVCPSLTQWDDWRRTLIFNTYAKCGEKNCKVLIDSGSCTNVVPSNIVHSIGLTPIAHPQPY